MSISSADLAIAVSQTSKHLLISLSGDLDSHSAPSVGDALFAAAACQEQAVLVDMSGVGSIDSSGLSVLLSGYRHLSRVGGWLLVVDPSPAVTRVFEISGLDKTIPVLRRDHRERSQPRMFPEEHSRL